jgi:DNA mismatch repair protein MutL
VRAVPVVLGEEDPDDVLRALADALLDAGSDDADERLQRQIARLGAIKAGQVLTVEQMQGVIQALERCPTPREDPDGRPTMVHISGEDLARQFGRG